MKHLKSNVGSIDKGFRILGAMFIAGAYYNKEITGITAIVLLVIASVFIITSYISFFPVYSIFGISTKKSGD
ncbi:DUF2892 domain-containing protein [Flavobacterium sp.]|uniref:YgaP family membrane protein n=1 Tax=Flavobacterium sp. TaxID=239 RepID=UPI003753BE61